VRPTGLDQFSPVNADIGQLEVILAPEADQDVNPAGVKGIGELANVGTAAAIAKRGLSCGRKKRLRIADTH
jgi:hypothetical protein